MNILETSLIKEKRDDNSQLNISQKARTKFHAAQSHINDLKILRLNPTVNNGFSIPGNRFQERRGGVDLNSLNACTIPFKKIIELYK